MVLSKKKSTKKSKKVEEIVVDKEPINEITLDEEHIFDDEGPKRVENFGIDTENPEPEENVLGVSEEGVLGNSSRVLGIDISAWQNGYPYDAANAEGVRFAILRAGFSQTKDGMFETHYANAKRLGWGVGAYWYMYARSVEGAKAEARAFLNAIAGKQFEYPIYLDVEDPSISGLGRDTLNAMVRAFGETIENAGYYFGVYSNLNWYRNIISGPELNKKYDWWVACWSTSAPSGINYGLWQFGGETNYIRGNKVAGIVTDQNYALKDYPAIMKAAGLNGFSKTPAPQPTPQPAPQPKPTPVQEEWPKSYTIQSGDTLSGIAFKFYGNGDVNHYMYIARANGIQNPNIISAGRTITIPKYNSGNVPSGTINKGDRVKIVSAYASSSTSKTANNTYAIGWDRVVMAVYNGANYPYAVGDGKGITGFCKATGLKKL